jgi:hypothetical protein
MFDPTIEAAAKIENPARPMISPNLMFPFFRKIEAILLPEIRVNTIMVITINTVLDSIEITMPSIVLGRLSKTPICH